MRISAPGFRTRSAIESAFSPDGVHLATVGRDAVIWSVSERRRLRSTRLVKHPSALAFSPDGSQLLVKSTSGELHLCATESADPSFHFRTEFHDEGPGPLFMSSNIALDASWGGVLRMWDFAAQKSAVVWHAEATRIGVLRQVGAWWGISTTWQPGHPAFVVDQHLGTILRSCNPLTGEFAAVDRQWPSLTTFAFSPDGANVVVRYGAGRARNLEIVCANSGKRRAWSHDRDGKSDGIAWAPDGRAIVLACYGGFSFRDVGTLAEIGWLSSLHASHIAFSPDGRLISLGDWSAGVVLAWPTLLEALELRPEPTLGAGAS